METQTITLQTTISKPSLQATWKQGGRKLKDGGRYELRVEETVHTCVIKDATKEDEGKYSIDIADKHSECQVFVTGVYLYIKFLKFIV